MNNNPPCPYCNSADVEYTTIATNEPDKINYAIVECCNCGNKLVSETKTVVTLYKIEGMDKTSPTQREIEACRAWINEKIKDMYISKRKELL